MTIITRLAVAGLAVAVTATAGVASAHAGSQPTPYLIGAHAASQEYPGMASLQFDHKGDPNWHTCGAVLVFHTWVAVNAHCVTQPDGTATDPAVWHLRIGSAERTQGGTVVGVSAVLPHADWDWATGSDPVADIAMLKLDSYVQLQPFEIAPRTASRAPARLLGWGVTEPSGQGPLPVALQELDTRILPASRCAEAGITAGEICLDNPYGSDGTCYGDSGGPGLQQVTTNRWQAIGGVSRATREDACGTGATVLTDLTYYRTWIYLLGVTDLEDGWPGSRR